MHNWPPGHTHTVVVGLRQPWSGKEEKSNRDWKHTKKLRVEKQKAAAQLSEIKNKDYKIALISIVNQWSLAPIQRQQESPIWGVVKEGTLFSAKQLNFNTAYL